MRGPATMRASMAGASSKVKSVLRRVRNVRAAREAREGDADQEVRCMWYTRLFHMACHIW